MSALFQISRFLLGAAPWAMTRGGALSVIVLLMGAALLGLSGWFITAAGLAGLAGIGIGFDFFRPSAGVRFLALGRAAARYGERLLTHDATLRALAKLRVRLLEGEAARGARGLMQLRSEATLTHIIADVDALDGLVLRLLLPALAGIATHLAVFIVLGWLVGWPMAFAILLGYVPFAALILWRLGQRCLAPAAASEMEAQALRRGLIDMIRDRDALILQGRIADKEEELLATDREARQTADQLDRAERNGQFLLSTLIALVAGAALAVGGWLVQTQDTGAAIAAIGVFVALALAETVLPLRRGFAELGRYAGAAQRTGSSIVTYPRIDPTSSVPDQSRHAHIPANAPSDELSGDKRSDDVLCVTSPDLSFSVRAGESAAITGPSGAGKTTLLLHICGLWSVPPEADHTISLLGASPSAWDEAALRQIVVMVPQRSALLRGTIRDNLTLACDATEGEMWAALAAVDLTPAIQERGGLHAQLGEAGAGLSGGQAKRLCLARALLKRPQLLLLDEPTEGLDKKTAERVLTGIREALPNAAIVAALHRGAGHAIFRQQYALTSSMRD
ncbi:MAG: ATP-binding cassette domain-containing protein [Pseudomonadota bacterium]